MMGFMQRIRAAGLAFKNADAADLYGGLAAFVDLFGRRDSKSGQPVTVNTALDSVVVFGIMRVLGDGLAQAPLQMYRKRPTRRGSDPALDHPLNEVLECIPNSWQTSFNFRETLTYHLELTGGFFAYKNRVGTARTIRELWPLEPGRVEIRRMPDLTIRYWYTDPFGNRNEIPADDIWHIRGPSWAGWIGMDPVKLARDAIGLSVAIEADQSHLYKNGLRTSGTYSVEGTLAPEAHDKLEAWIKRHVAEAPGSPLILDRAAKFISNVMTGVDAETLASRKFQVEEICRAFRVIPMMLGHTDKTATYASAEQMFIAHGVHTLAPRFHRIEQAIYKDLLSDQDRAAGFYAKFNMNSLLRGAAKDQANYFSQALGAGGSPAWMTQNEVRELVELNPDDDPASDKLPTPTNPVASKPTPDPAAQQVPSGVQNE